MTTETRREYWLDKPEEFYRFNLVENRYVRVEGKPVHFDGYGEIDAFLSEHPTNGWGVYNGPSGAVLHGIYKNRACPVLALLLAEQYLGSIDRKQFVDNTLQTIQRHGSLSPRYRWEDVKELE